MDRQQFRKKVLTGTNFSCIVEIDMSHNAGIETLGQFEAWILTAVVRLGEHHAYGMKIHEEVERLSGRPIVSLGAIYTALDRLQAKGLVSSKFGDATPQRGGRAKRFFKIEGAGQAALNNTADQARSFIAALKGVRAAV
jgi:PadR family transcriptional regulator, regulatory protein PadR